ncbi:L,D-transpeptidase [Amycolatopsis anabasis]|uniref:L,D-transpeptidase n=1 Tax=Amycolatopsis anabasis TaxID=1840409 RepID=UPI00131B1629|nr:L,D-transpeptidase [Amycolatopsis anabasis]
MRRTRMAPGLVLGALTVLTACSAPDVAAPHPPVGAAALPAATSTTTPPPPATPCAAGVDACVSLSARQAWLLRDGAVRFGPVPIMPGKPSGPTPTGTFRVQWKDRDHHSKEFDAPMPDSVFFAPGGIAFHAGSLQTPSNGCIHLADADARRFFDELAVGAVVQVVP